MAAVPAHGQARGVDGLVRTHGIAFDAGNLHEARDRIAGESQIVFHADLGRVLDLLVGAIERRHQARRECLAQFPAALQILRLEIAAHDERFGDPFPLVPQGNALDGIDGTGPVVAGTHEQGIGESFHPAFRRIERPIHEVLDGARHVAEVLGRTDEQTLRPQQVLDAGLQRRFHPAVDLFGRLFDALDDGTDHRGGPSAAMATVDQQQMHHPV